MLARAPLDPVEVFELGLELGVIANRDVDLVDLRRVSVLLRHIVSTEGQRQLTLDADACEASEAATAAMWCAVREEQAIVRRQASGARR